MAYARQKAARERDASLGLTTRVLRVRIKDRHASWLRQRAAEVNVVWNYVNDLSRRMLERTGAFASAAALHEYTRGATVCGLGLHSQTVQAINEEFVTRRRQFKKKRLRWRVSNRKRANYSLGWIPFKAVGISYRNGQLWHLGQPLSLWDSYGLADYEIGAGSFSEDARGRWYANLTVKVKKAPRPAGTAAVGIDLGLKDLLATSAGEKAAAPQFYRDLEGSLAVAQRSGNKRRTRALHAKIANRRKDFLHKLSTRIVAQNAAVFVGNVDASALAQTRMAKSVLDAGWSAFRTMLSYKCDDAGVWFEVIDERHSTQTCSMCGQRTGPSGLEGLGVREWTCRICGTHHDRDVNAARNILKRGLERMAHGAPGHGLERSEPPPCPNEVMAPHCASTGAGHGPLAEGIPGL